MALEPKELFGDAVSQTPNLRAFPYQDGIVPSQLETLGAAADLPHLTPLVNNGDGTWGVWADADADTVQGLLWAPDEAHAGSDTGETMIVVFKRGLVHYDDIPLPAGQTQATLDSALAHSSLRDAGIIVQGLADVA
jgi:hypothetical protein